uniref:MyoD family inhibitor n=2 Tax=Leptobrachium leishanense TaxID=445787 RepID=A0A8C5LK02_9ANUR
MSRDTYTPTPAPCAPNLNPDSLLPTEDEVSDEPIPIPSNNGSTQHAVVTEEPKNTYSLIPTEDEASDEPILIPSNNGSTQHPVVTEAPKNTYPSSIRPPIINAPKITNGSTGQSKPDTPNGCLKQSGGPKKSSSQTRLKKQVSRVSNDGAEPPSLPPGYEKDCCVQCTLALLFCQFLSLCNLFLDVLTCGSCSADSSEFCCSCCSIEACPDCSDSCGTDCGIVDACCESADCLEICMECCGLCFSN